jgi:hypothetical protein
MVNDIINTIVEAVTGFCSGMGEAFANTFNTLFLNETSAGVYEGLNNLGLFIVIALGVSLGYGVIRYLTGLFRREV